MAFSAPVAARIHDALARKKGVEEKKMFSGVWKDSLIVRLGPDEGEGALREYREQLCCQA